MVSVDIKLHVYFTYTISLVPHGQKKQSAQDSQFISPDPFAYHYVIKFGKSCKFTLQESFKCKNEIMHMKNLSWIPRQEVEEKSPQYKRGKYTFVQTKVPKLCMCVRVCTGSGDLGLTHTHTYVCFAELENFNYWLLMNDESKESILCMAVLSAF